MSWGKAKLTSETKVCPTYKVKFDNGPTNNIYRILPPLHALAESGKWHVYSAQHWGYNRLDEKNPKGKFAPIACIQEKGWGDKPGQDCPLCDAIAAKKESETPDNKEAVAAWCKVFNRESKFYFAAMAEDGTFCHLAIGTQNKARLLAKFDALRADGIDPTDLEQGVWVNIRRSDYQGKADEVLIVEENVEADVGGRKQMLKRTRLAPLTPTQADRALKEIRCLTTVGGNHLSYAQMAALAKCNGTPEEVEAIY